MTRTNDKGQDVYLEPAIDVNHEAIDPLGTTLAETDNVNFNICSPGGC